MPGKFDSTLEELLYTVTLDGGADEEEGNSSEGPYWAGLMRGPISLIELKEHEPGLVGQLNKDEIDLLNRAKGGAIIYEDSQGFVSVDLFSTERGLESKWDRILKEWREIRGGEEDD